MMVAAEAAENNWQTAILAPTEILAEQHFQQAEKILSPVGIKVGFLSGSLKKSAKLTAQEKIKSGEWQVVIGTHAIIQEAVEWKNLALAIIDEQHRFGVKQRTYLKEKVPEGKFPHILTMTATPIPRSLALTVFGELEVSTLDELPPGRQPIITKVLRGNDRDRLYGLIKREAEAGRQAYIVYPLVNDSEKEGMDRLRSVESEIERLKSGPLAGLRLAAVHGQMSSEEIQTIMRAFKAKEYDVLVSTTVIEVGVDVPNATVMAVENSERFGLAQLHQLRGRVGRGTEKSYCVLVTDAPPPGILPNKSEEDEGAEYESPWTRLLVLEKSQDGFFISEQDLKLRGPGDFFGTKQSGSPTFQLADLSRDSKLLEIARTEAQKVYDQDPGLHFPEHKALRKYFFSILETAAQTLKSG
jgi:ATP-dependent DNA helicase RecG